MRADESSSAQSRRATALFETSPLTLVLKRVV
jgi:hypothetical protein